jgi:ABC-type transport system involved in multi-copper enzyme maturation permease subunit
MSWVHLGAIVLAEIRKLFSRTSARVGLVVAALIGFGLPILRAIVRMFEQWTVDALQESGGMGGPAPELADILATDIAFAALATRNFFLLRVLIIMVGALSVAAEYQTRALREDLLRPVPRWSVVLAKWLAIDTWIAASVLCTFVPAVLVSVVAWGVDGDWQALVLAHLATIASDAGFAALVVLVAIASRSVAGTIAGMVIFYFLDLAMWMFLGLVSSVPMLPVPDLVKEWAPEVSPFLPSAAFSVWWGAASSEWAWQGWLSLGIICLGSLVAAERVFARLDVP